MNKIIIKENKNIEDMIYEVRGVQVMFATDVAELYKTETRIINQTIKRNIMRFPESFCFQLTMEEMTNLRSQIVISSLRNKFTHGGTRYLPYVLTEQGIMMLSGLLKSNIAVNVNIQIIDAFVRMRKYFVNNISNNEIILNHEKRIIELENVLDKFKHHEEASKIFFEGELYDAYSLLLDILNSSNEEIILIDNYTGKELLDVLKEINKKIIIVSKSIDKTLKDKYEQQYNNVTFIYNTSFHDRFIILDKNKLYACGASFKDLGKKCFAITEFNDKKYLSKMLKIIEI